jgi:hypothetical protein
MERDLTGRCGTCALFRVLGENDDGSEWGECQLGCWPSPLQDTATCPSHKPVGASWKGALARKPAAGTPRRYRDGGPSTPRRNRVQQDAPAGSSGRGRSIPKEIGIDMDQDEFRQVLREVMLEELAVPDVELGNRWEGGEVVLKPGREGTQEKRIPLETFFQKIVTVREKLRVLEQKINGSKELSSEQKVQLQQYITACYGSLTTFNVLFKNKEDQFSGQSGKG